MFTLTNPIAHIPAVLEVHVAPDFEGNYWGKTQGDNIWGLTGTEKPYWHGEDALYAGEQADMSTNYGKESSAHARNMSVGNRRMIRIEGLTANHTYYYRLHAGGDVRRGMFTTAPTAVATRTPSTPQVGSMTYATDYNGALVSPSSPTCASSRCTASVPADSIVYWSSGVVAAVP